MRRTNGWSPTIWVVFAGVLLFWGILTAFAYQRQEGTIKALGSKIEAYENQVSDQTRRNDLVLEYIRALDRRLAENGWAELPQMPRISEDEN